MFCDRADHPVYQTYSLYCLFEGRFLIIMHISYFNLEVTNKAKSVIVQKLSIREASIAFQ